MEYEFDHDDKTVYVYKPYVDYELSVETKEIIDTYRTKKYCICTFIAGKDDTFIPFLNIALNHI